MLNFKKEHIIKGGEVEYLIELRLNGYEYSPLYLRFDIDVSCRQKGKRKWNELKINRQIKEQIDNFSWQNKYTERNKLFVYEISKTIPNIEQILDELKEQIAEDARNQILDIRLY